MAPSASVSSGPQIQMKWFEQAGTGEGLTEFRCARQSKMFYARQQIPDRFPFGGRQQKQLGAYTSRISHLMKPAQGEGGQHADGHRIGNIYIRILVWGRTKLSC